MTQREQIEHLESQFQLLAERYINLAARVSDLEMLLVEIAVQSPEAALVIAESLKRRDTKKTEMAASILNQQDARLREIEAPEVVREPRNANWAWLSLLAVSAKQRESQEQMKFWLDRWESTQRQLLLDASVDFALGLNVENGLDKVFYRGTEEPHPTGQ